MIMQNPLAYNERNRKAKKHRDCQCAPGPERSLTCYQGEQRPQEAKGKHQTKVTSGTRIANSTRPAKLMRKELPQLIRREISFNHDIRQFHSQPQFKNALPQLVVIGEIVDE